MMLTIVGVVGCSSTPSDTMDQPALTEPKVSEAVEEKALENTENEISEDETKEVIEPESNKGLPSPTWAAMHYAPGADFWSVLEAAGIDPESVKEILENAKIRLPELIEGKTFHIIYDESGIAQAMYGTDKFDGQYLLYRDRHKNKALDPYGYRAETTISLSLTSQENIENLGDAQKLAVDRVIEKISKSDGPEKGLDTLFEQGGIDLTFTALFYGGKLVGPTAILNAKARHDDRELWAQESTKKP